VDELLNYVEVLPIGGGITITSGTLEEYPSSHNLLTMSARGSTPYVDGNDRGDLASTPCSWNEDGNDIWRFRMRSFSVNVIDELGHAHVDLANSGTAYTAVPMAKTFQVCRTTNSSWNLMAKK